MNPKADDPHQPPAALGEQIGHYLIEDVIGEGGMGVVYRARDLNLDRNVALKFPWREPEGNENGLRRFRREAKSSASLDHPCIVSVIEVLEHRGLPCLVLQLIEGDNLQTHIKQHGPLDVDRVLKLSEDVTSALVEAHSHQILHRDVTPRNILLAPDGRALLADFGLARALPRPEVDTNDTTRSISLTQKGRVVGTPRYMSPEQALGRDVDPRSDVFSFGAVMYEMCTGTPAFAGTSSGELLDQIIHSEPEPISRFTYEVPPELERIIRKAMSKPPDERYQRAEDMLVDIRALRREIAHERYSSTHSVGARIAEERRRIPSWVRVGLVVAASAILAVTAAVLYARWTSRDALPVGKPIQVTTSEAWEGMPALSPDGKQIAYVSDATGNLELYVIGIEGGDPLQLTDDPATDSDPFWFPDGGSIGFSSDRSGTPAIWKIGRFGGGATMVADGPTSADISPTGGLLAGAKGGEQTGIDIIDLDDPSRSTFLAVPSLFQHSPSWSPDGGAICYADDASLWLMAPDGSDHRQITQGDFDSHPAWSPSGKHVYFTSRREGTDAIWRLTIDSGHLQRVTLGTGTEAWPSVSRDGKRLAYTTGPLDHDVLILDRDTGRAAQLREAGFIADLAPSGNHVVYVKRRPEGGADLWIQSLRDGRGDGRPRKLVDLPGISSHPVISPDETWIVYYRALNGRRNIWTIPIDGGEPIQFTDGEMDLHPTWSPDGTSIAFVAGGSETSRVSTAPIDNGRRAGSPIPKTPPDLYALSPAWSPDGRWIAFVAFGGETYDVYVVDAGGGEPRRLTTNAHIMRVRWDAESRHVIASGRWGTDEHTLRSIPVGGGEAQPFEPTVIFGGADKPALFDLTDDRRYLVYGRYDLRGDIWLLEAEKGLY